ESFSLQQAKKASFQRAENSKQQHSSPGQEKLSFSTVLDPPKKKARSSGEAVLASGNFQNSADVADSGCSGVDGSTADPSNCFSCESGVTSPAEEFQDFGEVQSGSPEMREQFHGEGQVPNQNRPSGLSPQAKSSSPKAKRLKSNQPLSQVASSIETEEAEDSAVMPSQYDIHVEMEKRIIPLKFSLNTLTDRIKKLIQQQEMKAEMLNYRKFRAKIKPGENQTAEDELRKEISKEMFAEMEVIGQFNLGFIIARLNSDLFIIDQHASDEKYNFEMLQEHTALQGQKLITPQNLNLTAINESILMENLEIFQKNGFDFIIDRNGLHFGRMLSAVIPSKVESHGSQGSHGPAGERFPDHDGSFVTVSGTSWKEASHGKGAHMKQSLEQHVMVGTALNVKEMKKLITHMGEIEHPWNLSEKNEENECSLGNSAGAPGLCFKDLACGGEGSKTWTFQSNSAPLEC
ncbi:Mismatch repair endonuclease PMS2, partial [Varanus komodoensis]